VSDLYLNTIRSRGEARPFDRDIQPGRRPAVIGHCAYSYARVSFECYCLSTYIEHPVGNASAYAEFKNVRVKIWDVGGSDPVRELWRLYYSVSEGLIFVVDSVDRRRLVEARTELHKALEEEVMKYLPLLIFANKRDRSDGRFSEGCKLHGMIFFFQILAMTLEEIEDGLNVTGMYDRVWRIYGTWVTGTRKTTSLLMTWTTALH
jgi:hypothetical protein